MYARPKKKQRDIKSRYLPESKHIVKDMRAEKKIKGGELLVALIWSIPRLSQTGTRMIAPPSPSEPPIRPAQKPESMQFTIFLWDILSEGFIKTNPNSSFLWSF